MNRSWRAFSPAHGFTKVVGLLPKLLHFYWCFSSFGTFFWRKWVIRVQTRWRLSKVLSKVLYRNLVSFCDIQDGFCIAGWICNDDMSTGTANQRRWGWVWCFLRLHGSSHPGHMKCHEVYSDGPDLCDTMLKRELWCSQQCFKGKQDPCFILQSKIQS